jgi:hypothetical protein
LKLRALKARIINLRATNCGPCMAGFPDLMDTYRRFQNRPVELITISLDPPAARGSVSKFLKSRHQKLSVRRKPGQAREIVKRLDAQGLE